MNFSLKLTIVSVAVAQTVCAGGKAINDGVDPPAVVAAWSTPKGYQKIIDINFSDAMWPGQTWAGKTGADSPELADGGYVNTIIDVPANGGSEVTYPVMFHNCTFANKRATTALRVQRRPSAGSITSDRAPQARATAMPTTGRQRGTRPIWRTT